MGEYCVLVEPSNFVLGPNLNFLDFSKQYINIIKEVQKNDVKIAMTDDLFKLISASEPFNWKSSSNYLKRGLYKDGFMILLKRMQMLESLTGLEENDIKITPGLDNKPVCCDKTPLLSLFSSIILEKEHIVSSFILKDYFESYLNNDEYAINIEKETSVVKTSNCINDSILDCSQYSMIELQRIVNEKRLRYCENVEADGDHGNVFSHSNIIGMSSIPVKPRRLLKKLFQSCMIEKICFKSFGRSGTVIEPPFIKILDIEQLSNGFDKVYAELYVTAERGNYQSIHIHSKRDYFKFVVMKYGNIINIEIASKLLAMKLEV